MIARTLLGLVLVFTLIGLRVDGEESAAKKVAISGPLGARTNPVRCDMPSGERAYLARLRDGNGNPVRFQRLGSFGAGPYGNVLDGYEVVAGTNTVRVFMDMYHPGHVETNAIPGFTLVKP